MDKNMKRISDDMKNVLWDIDVGTTGPLGCKICVCQNLSQ
jgi:hypothetical protein